MAHDPFKVIKEKMKNEVKIENRINIVIIRPLDNKGLVASNANGPITTHFCKICGLLMLMTTLKSLCLTLVLPIKMYNE